MVEAGAAVAAGVGVALALACKRRIKSLKTSRSKTEDAAEPKKKLLLKKKKGMRARC